jgi:tetratricopeptide (TPR) repeat protein
MGFHGGKRAWLQAAVLAGAAFLAHSSALRAGFLWDDEFQLWENHAVVSSSGWIDLWRGRAPPDYQPVTGSVFWLLWRVFGRDPTGYHAVNIALHAIGCILLHRVFLRLLLPGALLAALAFAVHPVGVASVAWIAELKNTLSLVFFAASWLAFLQDGRGRYALSLACFVLAVLAKGSTVVLPAVLWLSSCWQGKGSARGRWTRLAPFFAVALLGALVTIHFQSAHAIGSAPAADAPRAAMVVACDAGRRMGFYLWKALWPADVGLLYSPWERGEGSFATCLPALGCVLLFSATCLFRFLRPLRYGLAYVAIALSPVLGFIPTHYERFAPVADHWQYLALIGSCATIAGAIARLLDCKGWVGGAGRCLLVLWPLALGVKTFSVGLEYRDPEALWRANVAREPRSWKAHYNLALAIWAEDRGRSGDVLGELARSAELYADDDTFAFIGRVLLARKDLARALSAYEQALALAPDEALRHNDVGAALDALGRRDEAVTSFERAVAIEDGHALARHNLAQIALQRGDFEGARRHYERALAAAPERAGVVAAYARFLGSTGQSAAALEAGTRALRLAHEAKDMDLARSLEGDLARWRKQAHM